MSRFKNRSNYFKAICESNLLIAHNAAIVGGGVRNSFHRINDEEELNAACKNLGHLPCVVHVGYDIGFMHPETGLPKPMIGSHLYFLEKVNLDLYPLLPDAIEDAYDRAYMVMEQFISYLLEDMEVNGNCGNLFLFNMKGAKAEMVGPINETLYGWYLVFRDTQSQSFVFDSTKFKTLPDGETGGGGNGGGGEETPVNPASYSYDQVTGEVVFSAAPPAGAYIEMVFFDVNNPQFGYINAEGTGFSSSPIEEASVLLQYFTPGVVGFKWRLIQSSAPFTPITEYTTSNLTVTRISQRYFKLCIEGSNVGVPEAAFPITPLNVDGIELDEVNNITEYITVMNADAANQAAFNILSYRQNPVSGSAQFYELLLEPTAPYQAWQFSRTLEAII